MFILFSATAPCDRWDLRDAILGLWPTTSISPSSFYPIREWSPSAIYVNHVLSGLLYNTSTCLRYLRPPLHIYFYVFLFLTCGRNSFHHSTLLLPGFVFWLRVYNFVLISRSLQYLLIGSCSFPHSSCMFEIEWKAFLRYPTANMFK